MLRRLTVLVLLVFAVVLGSTAALAASSVTWHQNPGCDFSGSSHLLVGNTAYARTDSNVSNCLSTVEIRLGYKVDGYWWYNSPKLRSGNGPHVTDSHAGADATSGRHRSKVGAVWSTYYYTSY